MTRQRVHYQAIHRASVPHAKDVIADLKRTWKAVCEGTYQTYPLEQFLDSKDPTPAAKPVEKGNVDKQDRKWITLHKQIKDQHEVPDHKSLDKS